MGGGEDSDACSGTLDFLLSGVVTDPLLVEAVPLQPLFAAVAADEASGSRQSSPARATSAELIRRGAKMLGKRNNRRREHVVLTFEDGVYDDTIEIHTMRYSAIFLVYNGMLN